MKKVKNTFWDEKVNAPIFELEDGEIMNPGIINHGSGFDLGWYKDEEDKSKFKMRQALNIISVAKRSIGKK